MEWPSDGLAAFFLVCFFVGLLFTVASFFLGLGHEAGDFGHADGHGDGLHFDHGHFHLGGGHAAPAETTAPDTHTHGGEHGTVQAHSGPSPFSVSTVMAFLTWFGGVGFILRTYYEAWFLTALLVAVLAGLIGAALVFTFLARVLYASQRIMKPSDYRLPGTIARVTSAIRPEGTGEIVYSKGDTRQVSGARSVDGRPIPRDTEVVIMRYERGLAYVQPWEDLLREQQGAEESR
jgi:hypothetical protein